MLLIAAPSFAGAQLVLLDGQVVSGAAVELIDDEYVLSLDGGGALSIPRELVREVRLRDVKPPEPPPPPSARGDDAGTLERKPETLAGKPTRGLLQDDPETLAGETGRATAPTPEEATAAIGRPSEFQRGLSDPTYVPQSDWSNDLSLNEFNPSTWYDAPIDPTFVPRSGFPPGDAFDGKSSSFRKGLNNTWSPTDGFEKRGVSLRLPASTSASTSPSASSPSTSASPGPQPPRDGDAALRQAAALALARMERLGVEDRGLSRLEAALRGAQARAVPVAAARTVTPKECGHRLVRESSEGRAARKVAPEVARLGGEPWDALPLQLWSTVETEIGRPIRLIFTTSDGSCRLVGGDVEHYARLASSRHLLSRRAIENFNGAMTHAADRGFIAPRDEASLLRYVEAVLTLAQPEVSGATAASFEILDSAEDLARVAQEPIAEEALPRRQRQREIRKAEAALAAPAIEVTSMGTRVTLQTWSATRGRVTAWDVMVSRDGTVAYDSESVAESVGVEADETTATVRVVEER